MELGRISSCISSLMTAFIMNQQFVSFLVQVCLTYSWKYTLFVFLGYVVPAIWIPMCVLFYRWQSRIWGNYIYVISVGPSIAITLLGKRELVALLSIYMCVHFLLFRVFKLPSSSTLTLRLGARGGLHSQEISSVYSFITGKILKFPTPERLQ